MIEWLRNYQERHARDLLEAQYLISLHGAEALTLAREWESDGISPRSRRHWRRIASLIARTLKKQGSALPL